MEVNPKVTKSLVDDGFCASFGEARRLQLNAKDKEHLDEILINKIKKWFAAAPTVI